MITVRLEKALGHTHHLRLAIAKLSRWVGESDTPAADKPGYQARIAEHEKLVQVYQAHWRLASADEKELAQAKLKADDAARAKADGRAQGEYTDQVIADTIAFLEG